MNHKEIVNASALSVKAIPEEMEAIFPCNRVKPVFFEYTVRYEGIGNTCTDLAGFNTIKECLAYIEQMKDEYRHLGGGLCIQSNKWANEMEKEHRRKLAKFRDILHSFIHAGVDHMGI